MRQAKEEKKKILLPNSVQTQLGQENSEKNSKKIEKMKKPLSDIIFSQNGMRQAEKEGKKIYFRMSFILEPAKKIPKKLVKKFKNYFPTLFLAKTG